MVSEDSPGRLAVDVSTFLMLNYRQYSERVLLGYESGLARYQQVLIEVSRPGDRVLHLGCGHDLAGMTGLLGDASAIHGVDLDREALRRYPATGWNVDARHLPFTDGSFDIVCSEYVLEHLEIPFEVFAEVSRVMKEGGCFITVAPNLLSYKSLVARITPLSFHRRILNLLRPGSGRGDEDVYPTFYRANSEGRIRRLSRHCGLQVERILYVENGPTWFQRLPVVFELFRLVHSMFRLESLRKLRCNMVTVMVKPGASARAGFGVRCVYCDNGSMERADEQYRCEDCGAVYQYRNRYWAV